MVMVSLGQTDTQRPHPMHIVASMVVVTIFSIRMSFRRIGRYLPFYANFSSIQAHTDTGSQQSAPIPAFFPWIRIHRHRCKKYTTAFSKKRTR
jgi:hypothetical protein